MTFRFHTLDVFTRKRFDGNPLAVVLDADPLTDAQMQTIAREFNLSETIFVMQPADPANTAKVRIFFPTGEIPFAGHPTVGCAVLLARMSQPSATDFETNIRLEEVAGLVPVKVTHAGGITRAIFTAPIVPFAVDVPLPSVEEVARMLSLLPADIGFDRHTHRLHQGGPRCFHVPLASRSALARSRVNDSIWPAMAHGLGTDQVYVYTRGGDHSRTSFRARMYAPTALTPEDPATGSATALLAAQLLVAEQIADGSHSWELEQGYEMGRPSDLHLEADVSGGRLTAVRVAGEAVPVMAGTLSL